MNMDPTIIWLDGPQVSKNKLLGGKFHNLAELTSAGFVVPQGFGITTVAYEQFMKASGLKEMAADIYAIASPTNLSDLKSETTDLINRILTSQIPRSLDSLIRENYSLLEKRSGLNHVPVAIRSSGESEDLVGASFAGQYDTYLWVSGIESVFQHIRLCWASMFNETVLAYNRGGQVQNPKYLEKICVGVQQMVDARAAGVMFTLDPLNGDRSKIIIEACWGLGEGVVKGDVDPSRFKFDKVTFEVIRRDVAYQSKEYRFNQELNTLDFLPVEPNKQNTPCISDAEATSLATLAKKIENHYNGVAQDIEWAISKNGQINLLQARPETVWSQKTDTGVILEPKSPVEHVLLRLSGVRIPKKQS